MENKFDYLIDETVTKEVRYISFMSNLRRYDFAFMKSKDNPDKYIVIHLQENRFAVLGKKDLSEKGHIEHVFHQSEMEADEIRAFLREVL
ncbi:SAV0927 family protein [Lentibacillus amyloliquefaciens]|uniref:Cytoplasmic protein n=1 Tax=Lentibacillus amyloliquefaciens TaxID=1472767 RepID=A0A0U4FN06_9BACI|nr:SAV0927 family protein [Lentibacillus amyloliquefaciens]ALX47205.1 cytoplasmic protein [Lentibacillus amyloliquefaciens]